MIQMADLRRALRFSGETQSSERVDSQTPPSGMASFVASQSLLLVRFFTLH